MPCLSNSATLGAFCCACALLSGALAGWALGPAAETWFGPLGELYVTLIKMIAVPLVFFAVINAVASLHGQQSVAALGGRTFAWFAATAALAVGVAFAVGAVMQPGLGLGELTVAETDPGLLVGPGGVGHRQVHRHVDVVGPAGQGTTHHTLPHGAAPGGFVCHSLALSLTHVSSLEVHIEPPTKSTISLH